MATAVVSAIRPLRYRPPPVKPTRPADADSKQSSYMDGLQVEYGSLQFVQTLGDQDVIGVVRVNFSNGLNDKEIDTDEMLSLSLTGRQAMDHIESKFMTDIVNNHAGVL